MPEGFRGNVYKAGKLAFGGKSSLQIRGGGRFHTFGPRQSIFQEGIYFGMRGQGGFVGARTSAFGGHGYSKDFGGPQRHGGGRDFDVVIHWETLARVAFIRQVSELAIRFAGERVKDRARSLAPVDTGAYRDSIESHMESFYGLPSAVVSASDFKANWIEFGTSDTPAYAVLRRAAEGEGESGWRGAMAR